MFEEFKCVKAIGTVNSLLCFRKGFDVVNNNNNVNSNHVLLNNAVEIQNLICQKVLNNFL